jgi:hypothetical protein
MEIDRSSPDPLTAPSDAKQPKTTHAGPSSQVPASKLSKKDLLERHLILTKAYDDLHYNFEETVRKYDILADGFNSQVDDINTLRADLARLQLEVSAGQQNQQHRPPPPPPPPTNKPPPSPLPPPAHRQQQTYADKLKGKGKEGGAERRPGLPKSP